MHEERKEVLVVGAGPVGLWTALVLAEAGVQVKIIDSENRTTARSYACALHPQTLRALDRFGLAQALIANGRRVETVAFYQGEARKAEIRLSHSAGDFPFLLIVPQDVLESALEERLRKAGVAVAWNHRFENLRMESESVSVSVEELSGTSTGYIVPHWETVVRREIPMRVQFVVGADGHASTTRQRLEIDYQKIQGPQSFAAYEFEADAPVANEVCVVLDEQTTNVLWPLPGNKGRWTFQMVHSEAHEFPEKERRAVRMVNKAVDDRVRDYVQRLAGRRAPWFKTSVKEVTWSTQVVFEQRLVTCFGKDRGWLAGDAAHQTGPVGVQSMNSGFREGDLLAGSLREIIHGKAGLGVLEKYNQAGMRIWKSLLAPSQWQSDSKVSPWAAQWAGRITPCLPGLDEDLLALAAQLGLHPAQKDGQKAG